MHPVERALWSAYRSGDGPEAARLGQVLVDERTHHGPSWFACACARERAGDLRGADRAFARASRCREDPTALPWRVPWATFQATVQDALDGLPAPFKPALAEVALVLEDYPAPALLEGFECGELLGLFTGPIRAEGVTGDGHAPMIFLFRRPHEHACTSKSDFQDQVRTTLIHEFGHYLGYDEEDLTRFGVG
jgi:predicted Zn-dependent protease with MMP-like domain